MAFSIRLTEEEKKLATSYAKLNSLSLGEAFKKALFEKIEEEYDIVIAEEAFNKMDICPTHGFLMVLLQEDEEGLSVNKISETLTIAPSTVTRFVDKLVSKGYVERIKVGKQSFTKITKEGKKIMPEVYEAALMTGAASGKRERVHDINMDEAKNFKKFVWRYHIRLLSEGSVILQALFMSALIPYIIIFSMAMGAVKADLDVSPFLIPRFLLPLSFLSMFIATLNSGGNNLTSIGLSLERENFDYLKVLPFELRKYVRLKFWYLFAIQSILPVILLLVTSLIFHVHLVTFLVMLLVWFMASLAWSAWGYHRDYKHLVTNWSNVNELMTRDNSMGKTLLALAFTIGVMIVIGVLYAISYSLPLTVLYLLSLLLILISGLVSYLIYRYYMKKLDSEIASFNC